MATNPQAAHRHGYEKTDASPRGLVYFAASIAVIVAATSLSLIWLFNHFEKAENTGSFVATPFSGARPLPPPPRIQPNPGGDMQSYFQSQQNLLQTYGWIDRQNGILDKFLGEDDEEAGHPRGEALVNGGSTNIARYAEVGVLPAHGTVLADTPNIAAIEIGGLEGSVKIYRR